MEHGGIPGTQAFSHRCHVPFASMLRRRGHHADYIDDFQCGPGWLSSSCGAQPDTTGHPITNLRDTTAEGWKPRIAKRFSLSPQKSQSGTDGSLSLLTHETGTLLLAAQHQLPPVSSRARNNRISVWGKWRLASSTQLRVREQRSVGGGRA